MSKRWRRGVQLLGVGVLCFSLRYAQQRVDDVAFERQMNSAMVEQGDLERVVREEKALLGIVQPVSVTYIPDSCCNSSGKVYERDAFYIFLNTDGMRRGAVRHELYHILKHSEDDSSLKGLKYKIYQEFEANLYGGFGLKL